MTLKQLEELDGLADGAAWGRWVVRSDFAIVTEDGTGVVDDPLADSGDLDYIAAADPATVKQLIKALRKMADGYAKYATEWPEFPKQKDFAAKAAELIAEALED